jgi:hypothetical protein
MDNYVYFGKRSHFSHLSNTSGDLQNSDALTAANFGIVPANRAYDDGLTEAAVGIEVVVRQLAAADDSRGTALTTDFVTGALFTAQGSEANNKYAESGDVTKLLPASYVIASGEIQIRNFATDGTNGYLMNTANQIIIRELIGSTNDALTDVPAIQQAATFNMANFLGADPVDTATAAIVGVDVDGTALEKTKLVFKGGDGGATQDYVILTHAENKFKDICAAMESIRNGSYAKMGEGVYTFTDLINGGKTFWDNEFGIVGCHMVNTTL